MGRGVGLSINPTKLRPLEGYSMPEDCETMSHRADMRPEFSYELPHRLHQVTKHASGHSLNRR